MSEFTKHIETNYFEGLGWLAEARTPDGFYYRGEYKTTGIEAYVKAESALNRHEENQKETAA